MNEIKDISFHQIQDIGLNQVMEKLGYSDLRAALKWCKKNGVIVFTQGKNRLVNGTQFLISFYKPLLDQLKKQHPNNWMDLFKSFVKQDFEKTMEILHPKKFVRTSERYKPKSQEGKSFLSNDDKQ